MVAFNQQNESWFPKHSPSGTPGNVGQESNQRVFTPASQPSSVKRWPIFWQAVRKHASAFSAGLMCLLCGTIAAKGGLSVWMIWMSGWLLSSFTDNVTRSYARELGRQEFDEYARKAGWSR